ncbi:MAG: 4Fe-4S dicluster domain-containing protein [Deferrisomatales bacterium]
MGYLVAHFDKCTGCGICQLSCSAREHGGYNPRLANLGVRMARDGRAHFPVVCHQCDNAFCQRACPVSAIGRDEATGAWTVDPETCIGCGRCVEACPLQVVGMVEKRAHKCDLCGGRPECVSACPTGALELR